MTLRSISRSKLTLIAGMTAALTLAGCASQVPLEEKKPAPVASAAAPAGPSAAEIAAREIAAAKAELAKVKPSIYFDFDKFEIKPEFQGTIAAYAKYMKMTAKRAWWLKATPTAWYDRIQPGAWSETC